MKLVHRHRDGSAPPQPRRPVGTASRRAQHPGVVAVVALLLGMVATAAGAGIGIRHLQKTGPTLETVLGLSLLAVGLLLLGYATTAAWTALHRWWRLVLIPAAVVVLELVLAATVAVMYAVVPPTALGAATPADVGVPGYRDVTFRTSDGVRLSAWYLPSRNGAAVVLEHGAGSTRTSTLPQAGVLARHGYGVLMVDARGHGRSGGAGMDLGWYGDLDTTAAVTELSRLPGVAPSRIGVVGLSMGGEQAIGAAAADPGIRAVVAEGATGSHGGRQRGHPSGRLRLGPRAGARPVHLRANGPAQRRLAPGEPPVLRRLRPRHRLPARDCRHGREGTPRRDRHPQRRPATRPRLDRARSRPHARAQDGADGVGTPRHRVPRRAAAAVRVLGPASC